jgi:hypothetical protein
MNPNYKGPQPSLQFRIDLLSCTLETDLARLDELARELSALKDSINHTQNRLQELRNEPAQD